MSPSRSARRRLVYGRRRRPGAARVRRSATAVGSVPLSPSGEAGKESLRGDRSPRGRQARRRSRPGAVQRRRRHPHRRAHRAPDHREDRLRAGPRRRARDRRHPHRRSGARPQAGRRDRRVHRRHARRRHGRPHALPRRPAPRPRPRRSATPRCPTAASTTGWSCWSTTCCSPAGRCAPRSTRWASTGVRARCSWPCSSTAGTASCRSAPTTSARTSRPRSGESIVVLLTETDGRDGVALRRPPTSAESAGAGA